MSTLAKLQMYAVHVTSRSGGDGEGRSASVPDSEIVYKQRKKDSIPIRVFNFIKQRFNPQAVPGELTSVYFSFFHSYKFFGLLDTDIISSEIVVCGEMKVHPNMKLNKFIR